MNTTAGPVDYAELLATPWDSVVGTAWAAACSAIPNDNLRWGIMMMASPFLQVIVSTFFDLVDRRGWLQSWKIDNGLKGPASVPDEALTAKARGLLLANCVLTVPASAIGVFIDLYFVPDMFSQATVPGLGMIGVQVAVGLLLLDFIYYWGHRYGHVKSVYWIHKQHHEFHAVNGWSATYLHAIEGLGGVLEASLVGGFLYMHAVTRFLFLLTFNVISVYQHVGYELPFWPNDIARFHNYHHAHNVGNFGVVTTFWDWLFGTDKAYKKFLARQKAKQSKALHSNMCSFSSL